MRLTLHEFDPDAATCCYDSFSQSDEDIQDWGGIAFAPYTPMAFAVLEYLACELEPEFKPLIMCHDGTDQIFLLVKKEEWDLHRKKWEAIKCQPLYDLIEKINLGENDQIQEQITCQWTEEDRIADRINTLMEAGEHDLSMAIMEDMPESVFNYQFNLEIQHLIGT